MRRIAPTSSLILLGCSAAIVLLAPACEADRRGQPRGRPAAETAPAERRPKLRPEPQRAHRPSPPRPGRVYKELDRDAFNRLAVLLNQPLFWGADANGNGAVDPDEVRSLLFYPDYQSWADRGEFTRAFDQVYDQMLALHRPDRAQEATRLPTEEVRRRALVADELAQGKATLVWSDLSGSPEEDKRLVRRMLRVASLIDGLYATQLGISALGTLIPADDPASRSLLRRNWSPRCKGPRTEKTPACTAVPGMTEAPPVALYPPELQKDKAFCTVLEKHPDTKALLAPFVVVRQQGARLVAVPYTDVFGPAMSAIATELEAAATELKGPTEAPLAAYLRAAAKAFRSGDWQPADEAWAKMNAKSSRWYLRVGPDETYWEPCSRKAGFHLTFALINPGSLAWQDKLGPVRQAMEDELARRIGAPYQPRKVSFRLPDFIDIVLNAGDDRHPFGATIGQSLPNWGPVANDGRGRTVAMSNLYTDPDSGRVRREQAESLLTGPSLAFYPDRPDYGLLATILHEATHNFGPSHEYQVAGKKDGEIFGGALATVMEELKAQTGGIWFVEFLRKRGLIDDAMAKKTYAEGFLWALGHISRGMFTDTGRPKPYSQLSAIQVGFLLQAGAVSYDPVAPAANGKDRGAFTLHLDKFPAALDRLMAEVGAIKAKGDRAAAEALVARFVTSQVVPQKIIAERLLRHPKTSFVYGIDL